MARQAHYVGVESMKRRILLVDDELAILLTLKAILEMNGFEVETASSGREAVQKLDGSVFQMVITDMRMETETAGYDVIRAAKQKHYNPATSILTAYPSLGSDWKSKGAQSLLVKPVNTQDLLRQIEALLISHEDQKRAAAAAPKSSSPARGTRNDAKKAG
jgi:DNA-binding NtrC family response regulator